LFYDQDTQSNCPGSGCPWTNEASAQKHLDYISNVLQEFDVDIWVIVEVEDCLVLKMVQDRIADKSYRPYLIKGTDTATGQNVGILTRVDPMENMKRTEDRFDYPIAGSTCGYTGSGSSGVSKHFHTKFEIQGLDKPLVLIGAHLIAIPDDKARCSQREAQAKVLQKLAKAEAIDKKNYLVMLGDLNDYDPTFLDANNDVPISTVLTILKTNPTTGAEYMLNVNSQITPQAERYSCWWDRDNNCKVGPNELSLIDHLLISKELKGLISQNTIAHSAFNASCHSFYSDHWPVIVRFDLSMHSHH